MIYWDNIMNTNEIIQNRSDNQSRMRPLTDGFVHNYYPINFGMQPIMYNYSPQVVLNTNGGYPLVNNTTESSQDQSGILSPNIETGLEKPLYRIAKWHEIFDKYDGNEQHPKCGRLMNNVYFTQRATSSDIYMLFDKKSDYINHFVNYYFSDKNLARDTKLVALMDDNGIIPLSALIQFPKLQQIDSTIEDLVKAFQNNTIVTSVDKNGEKGAQRRDKWFPANSQKNEIEKQTEIGTETLNTSSIPDQPQAIIQTENVMPNSPPYFYIPSLIPPSMYPQQSAMIANTSGLPSYPSYTFLPFQAHPTNQPGLNAQSGQQTYIWPIPTLEYGNQNLLQNMPINRYTSNSEASANR